MKTFILDTLRWLKRDKYMYIYVRKSQLIYISNRLSCAPTHTLAPPVRQRHKEESRVDINIYIPKEPNCNCLMKQISDLTDFAGKTNKEKQRKSKINSKTLIPYLYHINCILVTLTCSYKCALSLIHI